MCKIRYKKTGYQLSSIGYSDERRKKNRIVRVDCVYFLLAGGYMVLFLSDSQERSLELNDRFFEFARKIV